MERNNQEDADEGVENCLVFVARNRMRSSVLKTCQIKESVTKQKTGWQGQDHEIHKDY